MILFGEKIKFKMYNFVSVPKMLTFPLPTGVFRGLPPPPPPPGTLGAETLSFPIYLLINSIGIR